jgi:peroxiredoxin
MNGGTFRGATTVLALIVATACAGADAFKPIEVGDAAPAFTAAGLDGDSLSLADFAGKPVLVNIWATWCAPCRKEMPEIEELYQLYKDQGLQVAAVSIDNRAAGDQIVEFTEEMGTSFTILHDAEQTITRDYQTIGVPESFLIDGEGVIRARWTGRFSPLAPEVRALVERTLSEVE